MKYTDRLSKDSPGAWPRQLVKYFGGYSTRDQAAPGLLELARALLNSWQIPNDTRTPTDLFDRFLRSTPVASSRERATLRALRDDLRACLERADDGTGRLNAWIRRLGVAPLVAEGTIRFAASGVFRVACSASSCPRWQTADGRD